MKTIKLKLTRYDTATFYTGVAAEQCGCQKQRLLRNPCLRMAVGRVLLGSSLVLCHEPERIEVHDQKDCSDDDIDDCLSFHTRLLLLTVFK